MQGLGERMRDRARELGWSDAEVARRLGLAQTRYANYVTNRHEPDLATFVRICTVLGLSPSVLLGTDGHVDDPTGVLRGKAAAALRALDPDSLDVAATVIDALLARAGSGSHRITNA